MSTSGNAVIYCRISEDRTGEALGVARQEEDARQLAERRGWTVVDVVVDNDLSAAGGKRRPGFERVLQLVETGQAEAVIAWTLDRLTRNRRDTVRLIEVGAAKGATVALVRGSDLDMSTPAGRLTADLLAAVARSEIETKSDRQRRANQQKAEAGKWSGGRRPFGYEADGVTVREMEAQAVRDAYRWLIDGVSVATITQRWNVAGLLPPQGAKVWSSTSVASCLRKHRYAGVRAVRGVPVGQAEWPALVDEPTWATAHAILTDPTHRQPRYAKQLLTGIARCGVEGCGETVWAGRNNRAVATYRCRSGRHIARAAQPIDDLVTEIVTGRLSQPDATGLLVPSDPDRVGELAVEGEQLRERLDGLAVAYGDGTITDAQLRAGTKRVRDRLAQIESELAATRGTLGGVVAQLLSGTDVKAAWAKLPIGTRREVIDHLMVITLRPLGQGARTFAPDSVVIEWRQ